MRKKLFAVLILGLGLGLALAPAVWAQSMSDPDSASGDGPTLDDLMPLAKSILFPGTEAVSSRPLVAAGVADKSLRDELDLKVSVLSLENGHEELQTHYTPRPNTIDEITIRPDLETDTYTVTVTPADLDALERDGVLERIGVDRDRIGVPQKIFGGGAICRDVSVLARDHTGSAGVIRASTIAGLEWRWYTDDSLTCLDVLGRLKGCDPAFGMTAVGCVEVGTNDGSFRAKQKVFGIFEGTPSGSPEIDILSTAEVRAAGFGGTVITSSIILPSSEPSIHQQIVFDFIIPCARPHT